jgi:hypothetical protein
MFLFFFKIDTVIVHFSWAIDVVYYNFIIIIFLFFFICRWMDAVSNTGSRWLYLPLRAVCLRWCGQRNVGILEDMASAASTASSSQAAGLGWPFHPPASTSTPVLVDPGTRIRSRFLGRCLEQPLLQARAARLAAQAAQVDFALLFMFLSLILHWLSKKRKICDQ